MSDDVTLPQVPESKPEDPEDVSWALSTAEAMWARGDHSDGIKWVRRAAEAASEAENDTRALELAKAAADLTNLVARQSRGSGGSIQLEDILPASPPPPVPVRTLTGAPPAKTPSTAPAAPKTLQAPPVTPSRAPAPLPSRSSAPPRTNKAFTSDSKPPSTKPGGAVSVRPAAQQGKKRRSRENFDAEMREAPPPRETARLVALDSSPDFTDTAETVAIQVPHRRRELGGNEPTVVGHINDIVRAATSTAEEWETMVDNGSAGDRKTAVGNPPAPSLKMTLQNASPRTNLKPPGTALANIIAAKASRAAATPTEQHDPGILTSQAVRVVVWRDANGVHVAPAGTVVSAITVDAMLVALEPSADLTAWLSAGEAGPGQQRR